MTDRISPAGCSRPRHHRPSRRPVDTSLAHGATQNTRRRTVPKLIVSVIKKDRPCRERFACRRAFGTRLCEPPDVTGLSSNPLLQDRTCSQLPQMGRWSCFRSVTMESQPPSQAKLVRHFSVLQAASPRHVPTCTACWHRASARSQPQARQRMQALTA